MADFEKKIKGKKNYRSVFFDDDLKVIGKKYHR